MAVQNFIFIQSISFRRGDHFTVDASPCTATRTCQRTAWGTDHNRLINITKEGAFLMEWLCTDWMHSSIPGHWTNSTGYWTNSFNPALTQYRRGKARLGERQGNQPRVLAKLRTCFIASQNNIFWHFFCSFKQYLVTLKKVSHMGFNQSETVNTSKCHADGYNFAIIKRLANRVMTAHPKVEL